MRPEPEFQCVLKFDFNNDADVESIKRQLSYANCVTAVPFSKSGYARWNHEKLPGHLWIYYPSEREYKKSWQIQTFLEEFFDKISEEDLKFLKETTEKYDGRVIVAINIYFCDDGLPELCMDGKVMQVIHYLNADLHININRDSQLSDG